MTRAKKSQLRDVVEVPNTEGEPRLPQPKKKKPPDIEIQPFGSLDMPRCPLCRYPLTVRMTRDGPGSPCPCQNPHEDFAPLGPSFVMPPGTPGSTQVERLRRLGIITN